MNKCGRFVWNVPVVERQTHYVEGVGFESSNLSRDTIFLAKMSGKWRETDKMSG